MTTFCLFGADGGLCRVFRSDLTDAKDIPPDAIEVADDIVQLLLTNLDLRFVGGQVVAAVRSPEPATRAMVNAGRQRRIRLGGTINGVRVTGTDDDARNLMSLALAAQMRLATGDDTTITIYRDGDNVDHALTPAQMLAIWQQSAAYVSALYAASWTLKAMDPIPEDYAADQYWPAT
jgi:Domain of unknown function (DUF4376)